MEIMQILAEHRVLRFGPHRTRFHGDAAWPTEVYARCASRFCSCDATSECQNEDSRGIDAARTLARRYGKTVSYNWKMPKPSETSGSESEKPTHVRKLNFGQSILTLDTTRRRQVQRDGALMIDKTATDIPWTKRTEFVRKWIETHAGRIFDSDEASCSSPVPPLPATEAKASPVFGKRRKRAREKASLDDSSAKSAKPASSRGSPNIIDKEACSFSVENSKRIKVDASDKKESIRRSLFDSESPVASPETVHPNTSPILDKNAYGCKRRRKKLEEKRKALDRIENKRDKAEDVISSPIICSGAAEPKESPILDRNTLSYRKRQRKLQKRKLSRIEEIENSYEHSNNNSVSCCNLSATDCWKSKCEIVCTQKRRALVRKLEESFSNDNVKSARSKNTTISEGSIGSNSPTPKAKKLRVERSPKYAKDTAEIVNESSNEDSDKDAVQINNDTDNDSSDRIEDPDTQDAAPFPKNPSRGPSSFPVCKFPTIRSRASSKDSEATFFSEAEQPPCITVDSQSSQKISQTSMRMVNVTDNKSSQTGIIVSAETSPRKMRVDASVQLALLDSAKKRRKPKRGSLTEKLQKTINGQVSFVRVWRHRLKQTAEQNTAVPCLVVRVLACRTRFGRQFLEGTVIEDPFDLLERKDKARAAATSIKIMIIPEIVGRVEMKSEGLIEIFPPWETLDSEEPMVNATYIRVVSDGERDSQRCNANLCRSKRTIVKEFRCSCKNMNFACEDRFKKPDVIEKIFAGS